DLDRGGARGDVPGRRRRVRVVAGDVREAPPERAEGVLGDVVGAGVDVVELLHVARAAVGDEAERRRRERVRVAGAGVEAPAARVVGRRVLDDPDRAARAERAEHDVLLLGGGRVGRARLGHHGREAALVAEELGQVDAALDELGRRPRAGGVAGVGRLERPDRRLVPRVELGAGAVGAGAPAGGVLEGGDRLEGAAHVAVAPDPLVDADLLRAAGDLV